MDLLETRVRALEVSATRWRVTAICLICAIVGGAAMEPAPAQPKVIEAERLIFRDRSGNVRMDLRSAPAEGEALAWVGLTFYNDEGREAGRLRMAGNTPLLMFNGSEKDKAANTESTIRKFGSKLTDTDREVMRLTARKAGQAVVSLDTDVLSIIHGNDNDSASVVGAGTIYVYGGAIHVKGKPDATASVCVGPTETKNAKTGAVTRHSPATLTIYNDKGEVSFQAP